MANFTLDQTGQEIQDILDTVGNNEATSGQVLTADGSGGASWQNASGGKSYIHLINASHFDMVVYNSSSTTFTVATLAKFLYDAGFNNTNKLYTICNAEQRYGEATNTNRVWKGIYSVNGIYLRGYYSQFTYTIDNGNIVITETSGYESETITDTVTEL